MTEDERHLNWIAKAADRIIEDLPEVTRFHSELCTAIEEIYLAEFGSQGLLDHSAPPPSTKHPQELKAMFCDEWITDDFLVARSSYNRALLEAYQLGKTTSHHPPAVQPWVAEANQAYCDYANQLTRPECLGHEKKLKDGKFGELELKAYIRSGVLLGKHQAFAEVAAHASESGTVSEREAQLVKAATEAASELEADWYAVTIYDTVNEKFNDIGRQLRSALSAYKEGK